MQASPREEGKKTMMNLGTPSSAEETSRREVKIGARDMKRNQKTLHANGDAIRLTSYYQRWPRDVDAVGRRRESGAKAIQGPICGVVQVQTPFDLVVFKQDRHDQPAQAPPHLCHQVSRPANISRKL